MPLLPVFQTRGLIFTELAQKNETSILISGGKIAFPQKLYIRTDGHSFYREASQLTKLRTLIAL